MFRMGLAFNRFQNLEGVFLRYRGVYKVVSRAGEDPAYRTRSLIHK